MAKVIYKYGTGDEVPEGAVYLCTKVQLVQITQLAKQRYVWHYFLVKEK